MNGRPIVLQVWQCPPRRHPTAIDRAVSQGADEVVILPYFLAVGRHVTENVPAVVVEEKQAQYPAVRFRTVTYPDAVPERLELLARLVCSVP